MKKTGTNLARIQDKEFVSLETDRAEMILKGLEQSNIPYFAKYDDTKIILTYDSKCKSQVEEILAKADSTDEEEILMFKSNPDSLTYAKELLPEIADLLNVSVTFLENKPKDIQIILAETYVNMWHSDSETIKKALNNEIRISEIPEIKEPEKSITRDKTEFQKVMEMERIR